jgi:ferredoxin
MLFSCIFLFLILFVCSGILFFFFGFFVPALRLRYDGIDELISSEEYKNEEEVEISERKQREVEEFSKACEKARIPVFATVDSNVVDNEKNLLERRLTYNGEKSCRLFFENYNSEFRNIDCCIGFGDCQKVCPQEAIVVRGGVAMITSSCNGCGKCVEVCPEGLISLTKEKPLPPTSDFKFWSACYRIITGRR